MQRRKELENGMVFSHELRLCKPNLCFLSLQLRCVNLFQFKFPAQSHRRQTSNLSCGIGQNRSNQAQGEAEKIPFCTAIVETKIPLALRTVRCQPPSLERWGEVLGSHGRRWRDMSHLQLGENGLRYESGSWVCCFPRKGRRSYNCPSCPENCKAACQHLWKKLIM